MTGIKGGLQPLLRELVILLNISLCVFSTVSRLDMDSQIPVSSKIIPSPVEDAVAQVWVLACSVDVYAHCCVAAL